MAIFSDDWQPNGFTPSTTIVKGDCVKIKNKKMNGNSEAFWVIVTEVLSNDIVIGTVNNHLIDL